MKADVSLSLTGPDEHAAEMIGDDVRGAFSNIFQRFIGDPISIFEHVFRFGTVGHGSALPFRIGLEETDLSGKQTGKKSVSRDDGRSSRFHFEIRDETSCTGERTFRSVANGRRVQIILIRSRQKKTASEQRQTEHELVRRGAVL